MQAGHTEGVCDSREARSATTRSRRLTAGAVPSVANQGSFCDCSRRAKPHSGAYRVPSSKCAPKRHVGSESRTDGAAYNMSLVANRPSVSGQAVLRRSWIN